MPSIHKQQRLALTPEVAWQLLDEYSRGEDQIFSMVTTVRIEGDTRIITTTEGHEMGERFITIDPVNRRVAYTIADYAPGVMHHHAVMEIRENDDGTSTFAWITDMDSAEVAAASAPVYEQAFADLLAAFAKL